MTRRATKTDYIKAIKILLNQNAAPTFVFNNLHTTTRAILEDRVITYKTIIRSVSRSRIRYEVYCNNEFISERNDRMTSTRVSESWLMISEMEMRSIINKNCNTNCNMYLEDY